MTLTTYLNLYSRGNALGNNAYPLPEHLLPLSILTAHTRTTLQLPMYYIHLLYAVAHMSYKSYKGDLQCMESPLCLQVRERYGHSNDYDTILYPNDIIRIKWRRNSGLTR